jgi:DNA-binding beta-propeller fold protein YncE
LFLNTLRVCVGVQALASASWPLSSEGVRLLWLRACCAVAEGADVALSHTAPDASPSSHSRRNVCVAAVLGDALHRVAVLGGREGMPRSLGSVYGGSVTRFLGGGLRGVVSRVIATRGVQSYCNGIAVSRDGSTLLVSDCDGGTHAIHVFRLADGSRLRVVGGLGDGPLQFRNPRQVYIAADGFVFVADRGNDRVQVLTPSLDFHGFVGVGRPYGVCANADVVVVSEAGILNSVRILNRHDGALLLRRGYGGDGVVASPLGMCFMSGDRHVAVAESDFDRVSVYSVDGAFIRHVGVRVLRDPEGVACSAFDELVVADTGNKRVVVFSARGELLKTMGHGKFTGVAMLPGSSTVVAYDNRSKQCVVFE